MANFKFFSICLTLLYIIFAENLNLYECKTRKLAGTENDMDWFEENGKKIQSDAITLSPCRRLLCNGLHNYYCCIAKLDFRCFNVQADCEKICSY
ncbi:hypothetical protein ERO13_D12G157550v2 [Gossypium hirsutum]|uniref:Embryo surrounding factor 1 brassicaceae domain-containing protein n=2 Tax=Gossypium TaxID=3633 RepID=A0A5D2IBR6_GOSTO|nr:hypothetical protein ERO13_D12G157550v2 [Gossypium hirsutum]TYG41557.1 hypothetical protein ES288_D12G185000v1 [Gossypium darwinii]TYH39550.1 hypothetical protein ES332_D12G186100v1 [Gossypium tomentosum]